MVALKSQYNPAGSYVKTGFGLNWQIIKSKKGFKELEAEHIEEVYEQSKKRLILVDSDGVLPVKFNPATGMEEICHEAISILDTLSQDPNNTVFVISPSSKKLLQSWFSKANNLGLAAENGFFWRWNSPDQGDKWNTLIEVEDLVWIP